MATLYTQEPSFAAFVQSLVALPYLPLEEITAALEELQEFKFDQEIPEKDHDKIEEFKSALLKYTNDQWVNGDFPPRVWNFFGHARNNTNNR